MSLFALTCSVKVENFPTFVKTHSTAKVILSQKLGFMHGELSEK